MPHGELEHSSRRIAPSASVLDRLRRPVEADRVVHIQALEALSKAELERISNLDFSFLTDNHSNDTNSAQLGASSAVQVKEERSPSPPREGRTMEGTNEGQRSNPSRSSRGSRSGDPPRGRQPRQVTRQELRSRSMSSSSTDASNERTGVPQRSRRTAPRSQDVATPTPGMSSAGGNVFPVPSGSFAQAPGTFLHPSIPASMQNHPQLYPQGFGAGGSGAHLASYHPAHAFAGVQPPPQSQTPTSLPPAVFALPGVDYSDLTPEQQQMLVQAHQQVLMVAAQQQQQRQQQQSQGTSEILPHFPPLDMSQWNPQGQHRQQPPNIFAGLPSVGGLPSATFPLPSLPGTRHDIPYPQSPSTAYQGPVAKSSSPMATSSPETSPPAFAGMAAGPSRSSATAAAPSPGSSTFGAGPSSSGGGHDDGDDGYDAESTNMPEDKRRRNTAASARFRTKKKERVVALEHTITELEGRADNLEKEAGELRKENSWLKEMVIMKGRRALGTAGQATAGEWEGGGGVAVASSSSGGVAPAGARRNGARGNGAETSHRSGPSRNKMPREQNDEDEEDEDEGDD